MQKVSEQVQEIPQSLWSNQQHCEEEPWKINTNKTSERQQFTGGPEGPEMLT